MLYRKCRSSTGPVGAVGCHARQGLKYKDIMGEYKTRSSVCLEDNMSKDEPRKTRLETEAAAKPWRTHMHAVELELWVGSSELVAPAHWWLLSSSNVGPMLGVATL